MMLKRATHEATPNHHFIFLFFMSFIFSLKVGDEIVLSEGPAEDDGPSTEQISSKKLCGPSGKSYLINNLSLPPLYHYIIRMIHRLFKHFSRLGAVPRTDDIVVFQHVYQLGTSGVSDPELPL